MTTLRIFFAVALVGCFGAALTQDAESGAALVREPRGHKKRLCRKYGICGDQGFGGQHGFQQGYQPGYQQGYPAINIGISQAQSSAAGGGGGYSNGYYPNNNQFNGPQPGYGGYQGFGGYPNQGYGGRPGFSNGQGGYNNQFNGNYYGPGAGNGYGFPGHFQGYNDEAHDDHGHGDDDLSQQEQNDQALFGDHNEPHQGPYGQGSQGPHGHGHYGQDYSVAGSFAFAGRKNN